VAHGARAVAGGVGGDQHGQALVGAGAGLADGLVRVVLARDRQRGDVVVDELAPLHEHVRERGLDLVAVRVEGAGEQARVRQLAS